MQDKLQKLREALKDSVAWWHKSYILDWVVNIVLFLIVQGVTYFLSPLERYLPPNDPAVAYPVRPDIVSNFMLFVLAMFLPLFVILLMQIKRRSVHDLHHAILTLVITILLANTITGALKYAAGRYRPNWLAAQNGNEGHLSFPSGHSSTSFAGMLFLALYLHGKFRVYSHDHSASFSKSILLASPMAIAFFISLSRAIDYHHNFSDIIAGAMIGLGVGYYAYFLYYPPLSSKNCDQPKFHPAIKNDTLPTLADISVQKEQSATVINPPAAYVGKEVIDV